MLGLARAEVDRELVATAVRRRRREREVQGAIRSEPP